MKLGLFSPSANPFATPEFLAALGRGADERGIHSLWVPEHVVLFDDYASSYPYAADGKIPAPPGSGMLDPLTSLAFLAACTEHVRLGTGICLLPQRNPVYTAKEVATVDWLSNGRVDFGIGVGWLREEFEALGVPFDRRGRRTEEYLAVCRALWAGGEARYDGELVRIPPVRTGPRPAQQPHPPIWIAGNSPAAIRRAARIGDGWHAIDLRSDEIVPAVRRLHAAATAAGRDPAAVGVSLRTTVVPDGSSRHPFSGDVDAIRRDRDACADAGVSDLIANLRGGVRSVEVATDRIWAITRAFAS